MGGSSCKKTVTCTPGDSGTARSPGGGARGGAQMARPSRPSEKIARRALGDPLARPLLQSTATGRQAARPRRGARARLAHDDPAAAAAAVVVVVVGRGARSVFLLASPPLRGGRLRVALHHAAAVLLVPHVAAVVHSRAEIAGRAVLAARSALYPA